MINKKDIIKLLEVKQDHIDTLLRIIKVLKNDMELCLMKQTKKAELKEILNEDIMFINKLFEEESK